MKRTPLKRRSAKRAKLDRVANPWRKKFVALIGQCELCNRDLSYELRCHEIAAGTASKRRALMEPCAILVLCNAPHQYRKPSCHSVVQNWPREKQLALLLMRRGGDYDLSKFWQITARRWPEQCDVDGFVQQLLNQGR